MLKQVLVKNSPLEVDHSLPRKLIEKGPPSSVSISSYHRRRLRHENANAGIVHKGQHVTSDQITNNHFDLAFEDLPDVDKERLIWPTSEMNQIDKEDANLGMPHLNILDEVPGFGNLSSALTLKDTKVSADASVFLRGASSLDLDTFRDQSIPKIIAQQENGVYHFNNQCNGPKKSTSLPQHNSFEIPLKNIFLAQSIKDIDDEVSRQRRIRTQLCCDQGNRRQAKEKSGKSREH